MNLTTTLLSPAGVAGRMGPAVPPHAAGVPATRPQARWDIDPATGRPRCRWIFGRDVTRPRSFFERLGLVLAIRQLDRPAA